MNNVIVSLLWHLSGIIVNLINPNILENKSCTLASIAFIHLAWHFVFTRKNDFFNEIKIHQFGLLLLRLSHFKRRTAHSLEYYCRSTRSARTRSWVFLFKEQLWQYADYEEQLQLYSTQSWFGHAQRLAEHIVNACGARHCIQQTILCIKNLFARSIQLFKNWHKKKLQERRYPMTALSSLIGAVHLSLFWSFSGR